MLLALATAMAATTATAGVTLSTSQRLARPDGATTAQTLKAPQRAWFNPQEGNYFRVANSLENQYGDVDTDATLWGGNALKLTLPADCASGEAVIERLFDFGDNYYASTTYDIVGQYDAQAKTLTIPTPFSQDGIKDATRIADIDYHGNTMNAVLVSCEVSNRPDQTGQYPIYLNDNMVFDVADDGTLTAQTEMLVYCFGDTQNGIFRIYRDAELLVAGEKATIVARPATVTFTDAMEGLKQEQKFYVANIGKTSATMEYNITGDEGLQLAATPTIAAMFGQSFVAMLTPVAAGEFNSLIQMRDTETLSMAEVTVKAQVERKPDFNEIVKAGEFEFSMPESSYMTYKSFRITDKYTGTPVAKADVNGTGTTALLAKFTVADGQVGVLSFKTLNHAMQPNGFMGVLDDEFPAFYNDMYDHSGVTGAWPGYAIAGVAAGDHVLDLEYMLQVDWYAQGYAEQYGYFYDLSLETRPQKANDAMLIDDTAAFGSHYRDRYAAQATASVNVLNLGTEPLQVTGSTGSDNFKVILDANAAVQFTKLPVSIEFTGEAVGDYDETMTIQTTAGDFDVRCTATVQQLPYDYTPIVAEGEFSFDTSDPWPFAVDAAKHEVYSTSYQLESVVGKGTQYSWLEARFIVPEGCTGSLSWDGFNSSNNFFTFMNQTVLTDGTTIFIDGENAGEFAGESECGSADVDEAYLTFVPGYHSVKFQYQRKDTTPGGDNRVTISNLALKLEGEVGIENLNASKSAAEYYDLMGRRVAQPQHGTYIRVTDGKAVKVQM